MKQDQLFRVLQMLRKAEEEAGLGDLDLKAVELLRVIGEANAIGAGCNVNDLVTQARFGSKPTIYSLLDALEAAGLIDRMTAPHDRRSKTVHLSSRSQDLFARSARLASAALRRRRAS